MKSIYLCLPVYNEEDNLERCLLSINEARKKIKNRVRTLLCLNGCSDNSLRIAERCKSSLPDLDIQIIKSKKGKLNAQEKMVSMIPSKSKILFIDSDTEISPDSIRILLTEMNKNLELIIVGAFPVARNYEGSGLWKKMLDNILNVRSRHPQAEISKLGVTEYHQLAITDPQNINTNKEHESRSKIFFHGRMFLIRSKKYWNKPGEKKKVVGDDSHLADYITYHYGKNKIRIRYDAIVYFRPFISLREHYRAYKRIYFDLKNLKDNFPEFKNIREHSVLILDKDYIRNQHLKIRLTFRVHAGVRFLERFLYSLSYEKDPNKIWKES
jgi:glycosyltransferase involved in cell wall biosynthesis